MGMSGAYGARDGARFVYMGSGRRCGRSTLAKALIAQIIAKNERGYAAVVEVSKGGAVLHVPEFPGWFEARNWVGKALFGLTEEQMRHLGGASVGEIMINVSGRPVNQHFRLDHVQMLCRTIDRNVLRRVTVKSNESQRFIGLKEFNAKLEELQRIEAADLKVRAEDQARRDAENDKVDALAKQLNISRWHLRCEDGEFKLVPKIEPLLEHEIIAVVEAIRGAVPGMFDPYKER